jgi:hypothetical protein
MIDFVHINDWLIVLHPAQEFFTYFTRFSSTTPFPPPPQIEQFSYYSVRPRSHKAYNCFCFVCFVLSLTSNLSAIWRLSALPVTGLLHLRLLAVRVLLRATGPPFLRSYPKDPWFSLLIAVLVAKERSPPILNVLGLTRPARAGFELTTYRW